jgi:hypothetical protein
LESTNITIVDEAGLQRAVADDLLQEEHEQEERDTEPAVHCERLHVPDGKVAPPEQAQRQHRFRRAPLVRQEHGEQRRSGHARTPHLRAAPAHHRLADQRQHRSGQAKKGERSPEPIHAGVPGAAGAGGDREIDEHQRDQDEWDVHGKDHPPRDCVHEIAARERTDDGGDPGPCRPRADRAGTLLARKRRHDHGQRARGQECPERTLQRSARDQNLDCGGDRAQQRDDPEAGDAD